jgi:hypothetical protein
VQLGGLQAGQATAFQEDTGPAGLYLHGPHAAGEGAAALA